MYAAPLYFFLFSALSVSEDSNEIVFKLYTKDWTCGERKLVRPVKSATHQTETLPFYYLFQRVTLSKIFKVLLKRRGTPSNKQEHIPFQMLWQLS